MSNEMRQALNGVKAEVRELGAKISVMNTDVDALKTDVSVLKTDVRSLKADVSVLKTDMSEVKTLARNTAVVVAGHTERFIRIEKRLEKLDEFDGIKKVLDAIMVEVIASRRERSLRDKSFSDQQATLTDHELRLTRIELRGKES